MTNVERGKIEVLRTKRYSIEEIAKSIKRSSSAVIAYFKLKSANKTNKKPGPKLLISPKIARSLTKSARKGRKTTCMRLQESGIELSLRTVQRTMFEESQL